MIFLKIKGKGVGYYEIKKIINNINGIQFTNKWMFINERRKERELQKKKKLLEIKSKIERMRKQKK